MDQHLDEVEFDFEGMFDADYLRFAAVQLTPERNREDADLVIRLAGLPAGSLVLDAPCGHGRISNLLAAEELRVTGLDASELFLDRARRDAEEAGVEVEYVHGDLRDLPFESRFDAIVNWFSSFGYWDEETNRRVLRGFHQALKPGGLLLLETINPFLVIRIQRPDGTTSGARLSDDLMVDRTRYDVLTGRTTTERTIVVDGEVRDTRFTVRLLVPSEWRDWLHAAGFREISFHGEDGGAVTLDGKRLIVVARA